MQNLLVEYSGTVMEFCGYYRFDTRTSVSFSKIKVKAVRSITKLDYIHIDLLDLIGVASRDG